MDDSCLKRPKLASGISIFLMEELGDARLRCAQLKKYIDEAVGLIEKSPQRDHFFEVAAHLIHGIPDTLYKVDKALGAAAMAAAKMDYEEVKDTLRPEKVDELERALEEVRIRRVQRRSAKEARVNHGQASSKAELAFKTTILPNLKREVRDALDQAVTDRMVEFARIRAGNRSKYDSSLAKFKPDELEPEEWAGYVEEAMETWYRPLKKTLKQGSEKEKGKPVKIQDAVDQLNRFASEFEEGKLDTSSFLGFIAKLEQGHNRTASEASEVPEVLRGLAASLTEGEEKPAPFALAATLRRVLSTTLVASDEKLSRFEEGKPADPTKNMSPEEAKKWHEMNDKYEDKFKTASVWKTASSPDTSGRNWKEIDPGNDKYLPMFVWEGDGMTFVVSEIKGPGIPLYHLKMKAKIDGKDTGALQLNKPAQFKKLYDAYKTAKQWHKKIKDWNANPAGSGGLVLSDWVKAKKPLLEKVVAKTGSTNSWKVEAGEAPVDTPSDPWKDRQQWR